MPITLQILAAVVFGLMCGSELNVAVFSHPALNRQSLEAHIALRSTFATLFGRVMPFWMAGSTLLNLLLLFPFVHLTHLVWRLAAIAFALQAFAVLFSLVGPIPINNRISKWTARSLPDDWRIQEHRWDLYHGFRTGELIVAFAILVLSIALR